jgi:Trk K+ transport system NAD-binding subunit
MKIRQKPQMMFDLGTDSPTIVVVGGEGARGLATAFDESATVRFLGTDEAVVDQALAVGLDAHCVDLQVARSLCPLTEDADAAVVAYEPDQSALFTGQLLRASCGVDDVVVCVTEQSYSTAFAETDLELVETQSWLAGAVGERLGFHERET